VLSEPCGVAIEGKAITISTAGITPMIRRFTREGHPYRLIVSLTAADPQKRRELMPIEEVHPLPELMDAIREYQQASGRRVTLAWTLLSGVNTSREDARHLAELTAGMPIRVDLIEVNDPSGRFATPSLAELQLFRNVLTEEVGQPIARRYSGGGDVNAGCGMLVGRLSLPTVTGEPGA
jgi:23S rRNA (adenine2503-C2)-methyltransferase